MPLLRVCLYGRVYLGGEEAAAGALVLPMSAAERLVVVGGGGRGGGGRVSAGTAQGREAWRCGAQCVCWQSRSQQLSCMKGSRSRQVVRGKPFVSLVVLRVGAWCFHTCGREPGFMKLQDLTAGCGRLRWGCTLGGAVCT